MAANIFNALVFVVSCWGTNLFLPAIGWAASVWLVTGLIIFRQFARKRLRKIGARKSRGLRKVTLYALALGLAWAALPLFFFAPASDGGKLLIACLSSGMLGAGVFVMASTPMAAMAFSGPIAIGSLVALLRVGDLAHLSMAVVLAVYAVVLLLGAFNSATELEKLIATQIGAEEKARVSATNLGALAEMTAGLAHEVGQPLAAATALVDSAQRLVHMPPETRPVPLERALKDAAIQLDSARQIIRHLRQSIADGEPTKEFLRLHEAIARVCEAQASRPEAAHVQIQASLAAPHDLVLANPIQMRQLLTNLIRNALDAMQAGAGSKLTISTRCESEDTIRVDVADTGVGISPAIKTRIFEPLLTTKAEGMGVGLSIARSIVEAHHGRIWAEPNPGGGTVFSFVLPLVKRESGLDASS
jgi:signal transduction histidine kinase